MVGKSPTYSHFPKLVKWHSLPTYLEPACRRAVKTALSSRENFKVGAVIVRNRKIVNAACNTSSLHAEARALRSNPRPGKGKIWGDTLVVARVSATGIPVLSWPCDDCFKRSREAGINQIIFLPESILNWQVVFI